MNYGNCCGCGKNIRYEKVNVCRECEDKYIKMVMDYAYKNNLVISVDILHEELKVPLKVLKLFEANGFLQSIKDNEEISLDKKEDNEKESKLAILRELNNSIQKDKTKLEIENKPSGPRMYTRKN